MNTNWLLDVAQKLEIEISDVAEAVSRHHVKPSPVVPRAKRISLRRIFFSGEKTCETNSGEFSFDWNKLDCGLWGILSDKNLRGKSTIIEIVHWLLRGRPSSLQEDVKKWIKKALLRFSIDEDIYEVSILHDEETEGDLSRFGKNGEVHQVVSFSNSFEFERAMSSFMMGQLALEPVVVWNGDAPTEGGKRVTHDWPFLSGAMFIGTDYSSLLGDTFIPGLSIRLMQMYLGLPWVSTLTEAKATEKSLKRGSEAADRKAADEEESKANRIQELESNLLDIKNKLQEIPSSQHVIFSREKAGEQLKTIFKQIRTVESEIEEYVRLQEEAQNALYADKKELQLFIDSHAAGAVFRRLTPSICPRCEANIPASKLKEEQATGDCYICNEHIIEDDGADEKRAELSARVNASEEALAQATQQLGKARSSMEFVVAEQNSLQQKCEDLEAKLETYSSRRDWELQLVRAEAQIGEVCRSSTTEKTNDIKDAEIISQLVKDVEKKVKSIQDGVLEKVSAKILEYANRFGMENYSSTQLTGGGQLRLIKGGEKTSYSKVTPGEKLRLKVATIFAIISVSHSSDIGRHPGLLMIDSPGSQEIVSSDLEELMSGMAEVIEELPFLQVFVASVASGLMSRHINKNKCVSATDDDYLW